MKVFKKILTGITVTGILLLFVLAVAIKQVADAHFGDKKFEPQIWASFNNSMESDNPRGQMFDDLKGNYLHKGMTQQEVLNLLGPPDFKNSKDLFSYNLGMWSGFRMDYDSLDIKFNAQGLVTEVHRLQH